MHNFKELVVWQNAVELVIRIYKGTKMFPESEKFNLISQMQRAAVSIASNIAEGCGRNTNPLFKQFLGNALGSSFELETQIIVSYKLDYLDEVSYKDLMSRIVIIQRMLNKLMDTL